MAGMLHEQRVGPFPVLDDDKVIGVVSEADLLTKEALEGTVPRTPLRRQERVRKQTNALTAADLTTKRPVTISTDGPVTPAARRCSTSGFSRPDAVTVMDGIVTIKGTPETPMAGLDIIDAARHMEGVVAIRDRL
jgi:CBS domain-containing protein